MKEQIKNNWLTILLIGIIALLLIRECNHVPMILPGTHTIDTVLIVKPYVPEKIKPNNQPVKVKVYKQKDSTLRNQREKQPITEDIDIKKNDKGQVVEVDITKTDSTGVITTDIHITDPNAGNLEIDNTGQVEEKQKTRAGKILQKTWKGFKAGLMVAGGVAIVLFAVTH